VELNFVQTFLEETDSSYHYTIPVGILKQYMQCMQNLNGEGQCSFAANSETPMIHLVKRHFLRYGTIDKEDIGYFIKIIHGLIKSRPAKAILDS
jgi:hypothetical protein